MIRSKLVVGNWKLNGSCEFVSGWVADIKSGLTRLNEVEIAVCPPFIYLQAMLGFLGDSKIVLGAQNVCDQDSGALTGEVSAPMLVDMGCHYVIVGHSERRQFFAETDEWVAQKFRAAQNSGLVPILCLGEHWKDREQGYTEAVVARQLDAVIDLLGVQSLSRAVIAYEPVWAIGTGKTATTEQAQQVHAYIRDRIAQQDAATAERVRILYGGSVKAGNAEDLFRQPDIDGGLIGAASLKGDEFLAICLAANLGKTV